MVSFEPPGLALVPRFCLVRYRQHPFHILAAPIACTNSGVNGLNLRGNVDKKTHVAQAHSRPLRVPNGASHPVWWPESRRLAVHVVDVLAAVAVALS